MALLAALWLSGGVHAGPLIERASGEATGGA